MQHVILEEMGHYSLTSDLGVSAQPVATSNNSHFFVYELKTPQGANSQMGLLCSVPPESANCIEPHEQIIHSQYEDILDKFEKDAIQTTPVLLLTDETGFENDLHQLKDGSVLCDKRIDQSGNMHLVWEVSLKQSEIKLSFPLTLADGHHRFRAYQELVSKSDGSGGLYCAIFPRKFVHLSRSALIIDCKQDCSHSFSRIAGMVKVASLTDQKGGTSTFLRAMNKWFKVNARWGAINNSVLQEVSDFISVLQDRPKGIQISDQARFIHDANSSLLTEIEESRSMAILLPQQEIHNICQLASRKELLPPNSTHFLPKFPFDFLSHELGDR